MKIKNKTLKSLAPYICKAYDEALCEDILNKANIKLEQLINENKNESKAVKKHTNLNIYPCISTYYAMQECGIAKEEALKFLDATWSDRAISKAKAMQSLCKLPGMYKKMPAIFTKVTKSTFGEDQGFKATFYDMGPYRCKFDMTKCLFCDVCKANNCPELVPCFCHTDDVTDGNIHPKLKWNRTKIMGDGADCCDFDLYVK